jgi:hypothetical protein
MEFSSLRIVSAALVMIGAAAPGSATVVRPTSSAPPSVAVNQAARRGSAVRYVRVAGHRHAVVGPAGCSVDGVSSFVGEGDGFNFAGGAATSNGPVGYAGVVAGANNEACDQYSQIGAGDVNTIGGDNSSIGAVIGGGYDNSIEYGLDAFIGSGYKNALGYTGTNGSSYSAIVGAESVKMVGTGKSSEFVSVYTAAPS